MMLERERTLETGRQRRGHRLRLWLNLRAAVIGAGRLGTLTRAQYAGLPGSICQYVVDVDPVRACEALAAQTAPPSARDYRDLQRQS